MNNDFESGFIIQKKANGRKKIDQYIVTEVKLTDTCPYCLTKDIKRGKTRKKHDVYAVVKDSFAFCNLKRWYYYCNLCEKPFFNTEEIDAYGAGDSFTTNFVYESLLKWLNSCTEETPDLKGKTSKPSLSAVAKEIGISRNMVSKWNKSLVDEFMPLFEPAINSRYLIFSRFVDGDGYVRGVISTPDEKMKKAKLLTFISNYSETGLKGILPDIIDQLSMHDIAENNCVIMYDYAPKLYKLFSSYFPYASVCINLNNLSPRLKRMLHLLPDQANKLSSDLDKNLFDQMANPNRLPASYYIKEWLRNFDQNKIGEFKELLTQENDGYIDAFCSHELRNVNTSILRKLINGFFAKSVPLSYETVVVKLLFETDQYKQVVLEALKSVAESEGRRFDEMIYTGRKIED